ncbi:heterogeneous nuclear ribonucleoprotein L-like [Notolabrus celidotus]|uniref:heterogeneous nuclear ribonucleoprotein L-like n=1 Tax=Notolabrus celidotus TaxID=1203425 RepID=UPI001490477B|nr:heterogeneous nuclear ribonucleoprotein L-like [Notolabrus celidotus]
MEGSERADRGGGGGYHRAAKRLRREEEAGEEELEDGEEQEEDPGGEAAGSGGRESRRRGGKDVVEESHRIPPSPVVHVRGLCDAVVEADLVEALEKFGNICYVMMMPFKRQALVEFGSVENAEHCVSVGAREAVCIAEQQAFFNFSTSQRITRPTNADDPTSRNKVLLLSVQNPLYPITTVSPAEPRLSNTYLNLALFLERPGGLRDQENSETRRTQRPGGLTAEDEEGEGDQGGRLLLNMIK